MVRKVSIILFFSFFMGISSSDLFAQQKKNKSDSFQFKEDVGEIDISKLEGMTEAQRKAFFKKYGVTDYTVTKQGTKLKWKKKGKGTSYVPVKTEAQDGVAVVSIKIEEDDNYIYVDGEKLVKEDIKKGNVKQLKTIVSPSNTGEVEMEGFEKIKNGESVEFFGTAGKLIVKRDANGKLTISLHNK